MITHASASARTTGLIRRIMASSSNRNPAVAAVKRRQPCCSLSSLDDRTLHDIGLDRTMLLSIARHGIRSARRIHADAA
jgi:uncharacterized protein YjiS (DUF1127 family)